MNETVITPDGLTRLSEELERLRTARGERDELLERRMRRDPGALREVGDRGVEPGRLRLVERPCAARRQRESGRRTSSRRGS